MSLKTLLRKIVRQFVKLADGFIIEVNIKKKTNRFYGEKYYDDKKWCSAELDIAIV